MAVAPIFPTASTVPYTDTVTPHYNATTVQAALDAIKPLLTPGVTITKFSLNIGDNVSTAITVTHNLNSRDILVEVFANNTPYDTIICDISRATVNTVILGFALPPTANQYRVVIIG